MASASVVMSSVTGNRFEGDVVRTSAFFPFQSFDVKKFLRASQLQWTHLMISVSLHELQKQRLICASFLP